MSKLRGITWDHPRGHAPLAAASRAYEDRHGLRVEWDKRSLKDFGDADLRTLARDYDLVVIDHPHVGEAALSGCLVPFEEIVSPEQLELLSSQSVGPSFGSYRYHGRQWALPLDAACQVSACRPDRLEASRVPHTWEDVFTLASELRREGLWMGMALCPTDCLCSFLSLAAQLGDPPTESGDWIREETTLAALEHLRRLWNASHPDSSGWNPIRLYDAMTSDDAVVYSPLAFGYINYVQSSFRGSALTFSGIPGGSNAVLGGAGLAVSKQAKDSEAAGSYCLWACGGACQSTLYLEHGGQPANAEAWRAPSDTPVSANYLKPTLSTMESAYVRPRFPGWPSFQEALGNQIHEFLSTDGDPRDVHRRLESLYHKNRLTDETF